MVGSVMGSFLSPSSAPAIGKDMRITQLVHDMLTLESLQLASEDLVFATTKL